MSKNQFINPTYSPLKLSQQQLFHQNYSYSIPLLTNSVPYLHIYSPLFVVTPMNTPMIEEPSVISSENQIKNCESQIHLDEEIFTPFGQCEELYDNEFDDDMNSYISKEECDEETQPDNRYYQEIAKKIKELKQASDERKRVLNEINNN
ncbi:hypothetical protein QTN25_003750 [Entamoeba marina]